MQPSSSGEPQGLRFLSDGPVLLMPGGCAAAYDKLLRMLTAQASIPVQGHEHLLMLRACLHPTYWRSFAVGGRVLAPLLAPVSAGSHKRCPRIYSILWRPAGNKVVFLSI